MCTMCHHNPNGNIVSKKKEIIKYLPALWGVKLKVDLLPHYIRAWKERIQFLLMPNLFQCLCSCCGPWSLGITCWMLPSMFNAYFKMGHINIFFCHWRWTPSHPCCGWIWVDSQTLVQLQTHKQSRNKVITFCDCLTRTALRWVARKL